MPFKLPFVFFLSWFLFIVSSATAQTDQQPPRWDLRPPSKTIKNDLRPGSEPATFTPPIETELRPNIEQATFTQPIESDENTKPGAFPTSKEAITAELAAIEANASLPEEVRSDSKIRMQKALEWIDSRDASSKRQLELENYLKTIPKLSEDTKAALAAPAENDSIAIVPGAKIADLEGQLINLRQNVEIGEAKVKSISAEVEGRTERLATLSKDAIDLEKRIKEANSQLAALSTDDVASQARVVELRALLASRSQQLATTKLERQRLEEAGTLFTLQLDLANRQLNANKKRLANWQASIDALRKVESQRQANEARRVANASHPALKSLAEQNAQIAETRIATAARIEKNGKAIDELNANIKRYDEDFADLKSKVEFAGTTASTGLLLQKQRNELPEPSEFAARVNHVTTVMPSANLQLTEWKQLRRQVADSDEATANLVISLEGSLATYDREQIVEVIGKLMQDRRTLLDTAIADQETLLRKLNELELANQKHQLQVSEFREFLNQKVLWIRSADPIDFKDLRSATSGFLSILEPKKWKEVVSVGAGDVLHRPVIALSLIVGFILLLVFRSRLISLQSKLCRTPEPGQPAKFSNYLGAIGLTFLLSARWPALLLAVGYRLRIATGSTEWTQAVGKACINTVLFLWACEFVRELCRRQCVGEQVFGWSADALATIRRRLQFTALVGMPLYAMLLFSQFGELPEMRSLQRVLFISILAMFTFQLGLQFRPGGKLMESLKKEGSHSLINRFRYPVWLITAGAPMALVFLSVIGFHFSALHLSERMAQTAIALLGTIVLHALAICWLDVKSQNRKLTTASGTTEPTEPTNEEVPSSIPENFASGASIVSTPIEKQAGDEKLHESADNEFRDLLKWACVLLLICGGWFVWSDVLPAMRILDQVELWQNIEMVAEKVDDGSAKDAIKFSERAVPTTLTDLLSALLLGIATLMIGRRLPGALELVLLEHLPLEPGTRRAIAILIQYAATLAGLLFACHIIHLSWSSVQWLAAAMTVGLGFGMQEIFANLVSGIILLFERPIRMGDLVTVGDITGTVTRMQIRATTITDFDRRELIVPNKKFITDNVINWTLTDPVSRIVLPVGVAYGTDFKQVHKILEQIAGQCPYVLDQPAPSTLFRGFGDSTLNIELRVFVANRSLYPIVVNELNDAIATEFARHNIEIAFPQRDLHVKSLDNLNMMLQGDGERKAG